MCALISPWPRLSPCPNLTAKASAWNSWMRVIKFIANDLNSSLSLSLLSLLSLCFLSLLSLYFLCSLSLSLLSLCSLFSLSLFSLSFLSLSFLSLFSLSLLSLSLLYPYQKVSSGLRMYWKSMNPTRVGMVVKPKSRYSCLLDITWPNSQNWNSKCALPNITLSR